MTLQSVRNASPTRRGNSVNGGYGGGYGSVNYGSIQENFNGNMPVGNSPSGNAIYGNTGTYGNGLMISQSPEPLNMSRTINDDTINHINTQLNETKTELAVVQTRLDERNKQIDDLRSAVYDKDCKVCVEKDRSIKDH